MAERNSSLEEQIDWSTMALWAGTLGLYFDFARADLDELRRHLREYLERPCPDLLSALEIRAHGMKGAARNIGLEGVADVALELEEHFHEARNGLRKIDPLWIEGKLTLLQILLQRSEKLVERRYGDLTDECQDSDRR